ncbi:VOC family protein [Microbacterium sp. 22242]|uniref:VOC family protein n=1 Tax=Microbacterium sp. 22242 TaxID=3453896 RepID=UPI003F839CBE
MLSNRSMPDATVVPVLAYRDVNEATEWLCRVFGFTERWRIGDHRAQLSFGDGAVVVRDDAGPTGAQRCSVMVRVADVDAHCAHVRSLGAAIAEPPADHVYGERQYSVEDIGGHRWMFSQTIADVAPEEWGAVSNEL